MSARSNSAPAQALECSSSSSSRRSEATRRSLTHTTRERRPAGQVINAKTGAQSQSRCLLASCDMMRDYSRAFVWSHRDKYEKLSDVLHARSDGTKVAPRPQLSSAHERESSTQSSVVVLEVARSQVYVAAATSSTAVTAAGMTQSLQVRSSWRSSALSSCSRTPSTLTERGSLAPSLIWVIRQQQQQQQQ